MTQIIHYIYYLQFIALPIILFVLVNWIGAHSLSYGYVSMTLFTQRDDAPAYNIIFRLLSPIIYVVLIASVYYFLNLDNFVINIWYVVPIYFLFRILYNVILNKWQLVDKRREIILTVVGTLLSALVYKKFIIIRSNLLPEPSSLTGEF